MSRHSSMIHVGQDVSGRPGPLVVLSIRRSAYRVVILSEHG